MGNKKLEYIKLILKLKPEQKQEYNKWLLHLNNEPRLVTSSLVESHFLKLEDAIKSFREDEVQGYRIEFGNLDYRDEY